MSKRIVHSGYLLALLATIIWSGNFIVARGLNQTYSPITISFFRWSIATLAILPFAYQYLKRDFEILLRQWRLMILISFLGVTLFNTLIYQAAHNTTALNLSLFAITAPFYVVILNRVIFKEALTSRQAIGFVVLILGLLMLLSKGNPTTLLNLQFNKGDLLMAVAASVFGSYSVLVKKKHPTIGNLSFVSATFILGVIMLAPLFIIEQIIVAPEIAFSQKSLLQLFYIGIGPSIISFYLWNRAIVGIGSTKAATIYNTLPIFSAFLGAYILDESIQTAQFVSAAIIVLGVLLVLRSNVVRQ